METEDGQIQENCYDAEGLRFELLENGKCTRFVYHQGEILHEEGGDEEPTSYHLGAGIEAFHRGRENYYYHRDEQLSTAFITGCDEVLQNSYQYDAFGTELEKAELLFNRIRYTGQQYDTLTEQYYLRARYYNPVLGRFTQEDVYQGDGLNLYAYCRNNPVMYYDPSGYSEVKKPACPPDAKLSKDDEDEKNHFPERTQQAQEEAQRVVDKRNELMENKQGTDYSTAKNDKYPAVAVFVHEDGTVSVGISGAPEGTDTSKNFAKALQDALNVEADKENKYTVSSVVDMDLFNQINDEGFKNSRGQCAEPKAATAAHYNESPITGMDVRWYEEKGNKKYQFEGASSPNQMDFCDTCKANEEVYMKYANYNKSNDSNTK